MLLDESVKSVSSSTIGRIIKRYNLFFRPSKITHFGKVKKIRRKKKLRRPHASLSYLPPLKYLLEKENFSKMLWTCRG